MCLTCFKIRFALRKKNLYLSFYRLTNIYFSSFFYFISYFFVCVLRFAKNHLRVVSSPHYHTNNDYSALHLCIFCHQELTLDEIHMVVMTPDVSSALSHGALPAWFARAMWFFFQCLLFFVETQHVYVVILELYACGSLDQDVVSGPGLDRP
jgi:hypothetical protein